jgi:hypothetical protein
MADNQSTTIRRGLPGMLGDDLQPDVVDTGAGGAIMTFPLKALQSWMSDATQYRGNRQFKVWHHFRYFDDGRTPEIWWHADLTEYSLVRDYRQDQREGEWERNQHTWTGYDTDLGAATRKALKRAKENPA